MSQKIDVVQCFICFKTLVEDQLWQWRSNKSSIYLTYRVFFFFFWRFSCSHTYEQNGIVDRKHEHIVEACLIILTQSILPNKLGRGFWNCRFLHQHSSYNWIVYLQFKLFNKTPNNKFLCTLQGVFVIISWVFVLITKCRFILISQSCLFKGYSTIHQKCRCVNPKQDRSQRNFLSV